MYVSANHDLIYRDGALLGELYAEACPEIFIGDPDVLGIRFEAELFAPQRYLWRWPDDTLLASSRFGDELKIFYQSLSAHVPPASILVSIADAVVCGSTVHCGSGSGFMPVYETHRPNDRPAAPLPTVATLARAMIADFIAADTEYLFLGSAGSTNYGHYLVDDLPRLRAAEWMLARSSAPAVCVVLARFGTDMDAIRIASVRAVLGERIAIALIEADQAIVFPRLFYASPVSAHPTQKLPAAMTFVARIADRHRRSPDLRLFVGRSAEHQRVLVNEAAVVDLLSAHGYRYVLPHTMSFEEQVKLFANASCIAGVMGAAMTNTIFAPAGSKIIYFAPDGWIEPFYFDLAATLDQQYSVLFGAIEREVGPAHQSAFSIDVDALRRRLDREAGREASTVSKDVEYLG